MLTVENIATYGLESAIRGMRNPLSSWSKSDSKMNFLNPDCEFIIGENDMKLCKALIKAGPSDRKFLRMIHVTMDITAPLYWWKEMDQYKVGTTTNSCSTRHTIHRRDLRLSDFSVEHLGDFSKEAIMKVIQEININRRDFVETKDKEKWYNIIQLLPSSFNQMRTWNGDYETLIGMYFSRRNHKLDEWHTLCDEIIKLPYMKEFIEVLDDKKVSD